MTIKYNSQCIIDISFQFPPPKTTQENKIIPINPILY